MSHIRVFTIALGLLLSGAGFATAQSTDTVIYYHTDAIGSVRAITDANGGLLARYDFEPFGVQCGSICGTGSPPETLQFAGKERDADTALDYFGARYYEDVSGRFIAVDPALDIEKAIVDPQQWNRYTYVRNNPLRYVDPDGRAVDVALDVVLIVNDVRTISHEGLTLGNGISLGGNVVGAIIPGATGVGPVARGGFELAMKGRWLERAAELGTKLGRNTERILEDGLANGAAFRVPDLLSDAGRFIGEVKDVAKLSLTRQLNDLIGYAREAKMSFNLFVNEGTRLSAPLLRQLQRADAKIYRFVENKWKDVSAELYGMLKNIE